MDKTLLVLGGAAVAVAAAAYLTGQQAAVQTYPVAVLGVDQTRSFTITAIGEALARLSGLKITCKQLDGTMAVFDILAGQVPSAVPGAGNLIFRKFAPLPFRASDIAVINDGIRGTVFIRLLDDTGVQLFYLEGIIDAGYALFHLTDIVLDMPKRNYGLIVEAGHI